MTDEIVIVEEWEDRTILTAGGYELVVMKDATQSIRFTGVTVRTLKNAIACHALLQRAIEIMGGAT